MFILSIKLLLGEICILVWCRIFVHTNNNKNLMIGNFKMMHRTYFAAGSAAR